MWNFENISWSQKCYSFSIFPIPESHVLYIIKYARVSMFSFETNSTVYYGHILMTLWHGHASKQALCDGNPLVTSGFLPETVSCSFRYSHEQTGNLGSISVRVTPLQSSGAHVHHIFLVIKWWLWFCHITAHWHCGIDKSPQNYFFKHQQFNISILQRVCNK